MQWGEEGPPPLLVKIAPDLSKEDLEDIAAVCTCLLLNFFFPFFIFLQLFSVSIGCCCTPLRWIGKFLLIKYYLYYFTRNDSTSGYRILDIFNCMLLILCSVF